MSSEVQIAVIDQQDTQIVLAVPGVQGATGSNLPTGGTANQVLRKASSTNYDTDWSLVTNAMVDSSAAIAGTKISPNFGSQNVVTTGTSTAASFIPTSSSVPTNGVYLPSANNVAISSNGVGRLFIDASGNVGVGATTAFGKLDVSPSANKHIVFTSVSDYASNGIAAVNDSGSEIDLGIAGANLRFFTSATERMRLDSSGRLGLGTSSPSSRLHVNASDGAQLLVRNTSTNSIGGAQTPYMQIDSTGGYVGAGSVTGLLVDISADNTANKYAAIFNGGNVGIGVTGPGAKLDVSGDIRFNTNTYLTARDSAGTGFVELLKAGASNETVIANNKNAGITFVNTNTSELARITSSGQLLVGTSSARSNFYGNTPDVQIERAADRTRQLLINNTNGVNASEFIIAKTRGTTVGSNTVVQADDELGIVHFAGADGTNLVIGASITALVDGTPGTNDMPGRLVFSVTADGASSPTEACRINSSGQLLINTNASVASFNPGRVEITSRASELALVADATDTSAIGIGIRGNTSTTAISFFNASDGATCGTIVLNSGSTSYNTSSDYRLKENVVPLTGAADRVNQLQVHRFNFIADPEKTVDGFIAHEAQAVVPECVTGTKDEVDENGDPVYQGIDQSKLVPLLTAALQEALQKIEDLEGRLTAAGL